MALLIISVLAIFGILSTFGLLTFHLLSIFTRHFFVLKNILISVICGIAAVVILLIIPFPSSIQIEKKLIFFTIILNLILFVVLIIRLIRKNKECFPLDNKLLKKQNIVGFILYICTMIIYLFFSFGYGLKIGWEALMK